MNNYESLMEKVEVLTAELTALAEEEKQLNEGQEKILAVVRQAMELLADTGCGCVFGVATPEGFSVYSNGPYMLRAAAVTMLSHCIAGAVHAAAQEAQAQKGEEG